MSLDRNPVYWVMVVVPPLVCADRVTDVGAGLKGLPEASLNESVYWNCLSNTAVKPAVLV
jgi:hypothetical protein